MATTSLNTPRTEMRASKWNRALVAACPRIVAVNPAYATSDALAVRCVR
jgi:hypothetical protein